MFLILGQLKTDLKIRPIPDEWIKFTSAPGIAKIMELFLLYRKLKLEKN